MYNFELKQENTQCSCNYCGLKSENSQDLVGFCCLALFIMASTEEKPKDERIVLYFWFSVKLEHFIVVVGSLQLSAVFCEL